MKITFDINFSHLRDKWRRTNVTGYLFMLTHRRTLEIRQFIATISYASRISIKMTLLCVETDCHMSSRSNCQLHPHYYDRALLRRNASQVLSLIPLPRVRSIDSIAKNSIPRCCNARIALRSIGREENVFPFFSNVWKRVQKRAAYKAMKWTFEFIAIKRNSVTFGCEMWHTYCAHSWHMLGSARVEKFQLSFCMIDRFNFYCSSFTVMPANSSK